MGFEFRWKSVDGCCTVGLIIILILFRSREEIDSVPSFSHRAKKRNRSRYREKKSEKHTEKIVQYSLIK
jgi:hypothetical protein